MVKKVAIIIVFAILIIVVIGIAGFLLYLQWPHKIANNKNSDQDVKPDIAKIEARIKTTYPEVIRGVISFQDTSAALMTTVTLDNGKTYLLWPVQPKSVYISFGAKNGGRVEIRGRYSGDDKIEWGAMKPL